MDSEIYKERQTMRWEHDPMYVEVHMYDHTSRYQNPQQDIDLHDVINGFVVCLVSCGYIPESIYEGMYTFGKDNLSEELIEQL